MGEDPRGLRRVKRRAHLRTRRDTGSPVAIKAESLRVVTGLTVRGVRENVRRMPLDEVGIVKTARLLRRMTAGADLFVVALRAVHGAAGSNRAVPNGEIGGVDRPGYTDRADAQTGLYTRSGKRAHSHARRSAPTGMALLTARLRVTICA